MRLRNKQTGEVMDDAQYRNYSLHNGFGFRLGDKEYEYHTLAELNEEWEDEPEEPKEYWYIDWTPEIGVYHTRDVDSDADKRQKEIGNYFETKEEAEKAVGKLKAWKRLKDKGFKFDGVYDDYTIKFTAPKEEIGWFWCNGMDKDLNLLFGGEE